MAELYPAEPILHMQTLDTTPCAFQQVLFTNEDDVIPPLQVNPGFCFFTNLLYKYVIINLLLLFKFQPVSDSKENKEVVLPNAEVEKNKPVPLQKKDVKCKNLVFSYYEYSLELVYHL